MSAFVEKFTTDNLDWAPRVKPVELAQATPAQRDAMKVTVSNTPISAYTLVLAHDPAALSERTPLYNAIMYGPRGLPRADRELGALTASYLNGCIYCASVHSRRLIELTKEAETVRQIYEKGEAAALDERRRAVFDFSAKLTATPPAAGPDDLARLRRLGLTDQDVLDLVNSVAMFAWANRLMQTLGDPVRP